MGVLEILMRPTVGTVLPAFLVGFIVGWSWNKWATFVLCLLFQQRSSTPSAAPVSSPPPQAQNEHLAITEEDLHHLHKLVEKKDGGPLWKHMMSHETPHMSCQAWQRDPVTGPPEFCTRTIYEDATPEIVRDFFWDDEFRLKWDDMILQASTIDECPTTGTMAVHWVRKFPFFCSDREYIIGRRIWESVRSYYCVSKGVPYPSIPRRNNPKRVDLFYSSWFIQAVPSTKRNGEMSACEVLLFHHEDMGIPWEIAKFGVSRGMRRGIQKAEAGLRAYQNQRASGSPISHAALMAQITTRTDLNPLTPAEHNGESPQTNLVSSPQKKSAGRKFRKLMIIGGIVLLACSIDRGLFSKTLIFGAAKRVSKKGKTA